MEGEPTVTHALEVPFADTVPAAGTVHRIGGDSAVLSQSGPGTAAALLVGPGATFSVALAAPARLPDCVYIPVNISVALVEYNDATPVAGTVLQMHRFEGYSEPRAAAQTLRWQSRPVPVRPRPGAPAHMRHALCRALTRAAALCRPLR